MPISTIEWNRGAVRMVDQTLLPEKCKIITIRTPKEMWQAIKRLSVRGAPAIGIAGAMGVVLGARQSKAKTGSALLKDVRKAAKYLATSRPTAVNLFWALDRMTAHAETLTEKSPAAMREELLAEAIRIWEEDRATCRAIGAHGAALVADGETLLTHCNAGGLATADYGTALAVMFTAHEQGKKIRVFADETRPLLQGSRITAWELKNEGIPVTVICDNMAAQVMKEGRVDRVIVGADRIAANGDAANKIGTYGLAVLARFHKVPFYVAAPISTFDLTLAGGEAIPIEQRSADEIASGFGRRTAPRGVEVYNPAFDVTPARLIAGIITEHGLIEKPSKKAIREHLRQAGV